MWNVLVDDALSPTLFAHVHRSIIEHPQLQAFNDHSYWFPLDGRPRFYIEHAILALSQHLPQTRPEDTDTVAGAEWWVPALVASKGMEWHCDCDRIVYASERRFVRPLISSILYSGAVGGPTLIVDDVLTNHRLRRPRGAGLGFVPMANRFGMFRGDRIHAIAVSPEDDLRITVAINWWAQKPSAPLCIDAPYDSDLFAPLLAPPSFEVVASTPRAAAPMQVSEEQIANLPHRGFCPVYPRSRCVDGAA